MVARPRDVALPTSRRAALEGIVGECLDAALDGERHFALSALEPAALVGTCESLLRQHAAEPERLGSEAWRVEASANVEALRQLLWRDDPADREATAQQLVGQAERQLGVRFVPPARLLSWDRSARPRVGDRLAHLRLGEVEVRRLGEGKVEVVVDGATRWLALPR